MAFISWAVIAGSGAHDVVAGLGAYDVEVASSSTGADCFGKQRRGRGGLSQRLFDKRMVILKRYPNNKQRVEVYYVLTQKDA